MMAEIFSEFKHEHLTSDEADFLMESYRKRGVSASKSRSEDAIGWMVTAVLQENYSKTPSRINAPNVWGNGHVKRVNGRGLGDKRFGRT
ncbi:hypothetical protein L383_04361 [Enterobacter sp. MGH 37]|uniref:hypothetical protein n=1 Tax=unclassified Enterobacter cloacae complex TaxID=2757714 RepID=UPI0003BF957A|nr:MULTISPECIES: hypothetical protein [unclassified Enterobacter cloacae complex]ESN18752.1 hypothetical protein L371_03207 [Enterobacter sp. MGH 25]EUM38188.1 hypothetical protein L383_04361 [Enterobacter sp. MGH 37]